MIKGKAWNDVNTLLAFLRGHRPVADMVDDFYLKKHGNSAPGELLREQIALVQAHLDEGTRDPE